MNQRFPWRHMATCSFCCFIFIGSVLGENRAAEAADLFEHKNYKEALKIWYGAVQSGEVGAAVYYNIGLAESQLQNTPQAVLAFEKALRFKPMNKKINAALAEEQKKIGSSIIPVPPFFLVQWSKMVVSVFRPGVWSLLGLLMCLMLVIRFVPLKNNKWYVRNGKQGAIRYMLIMAIISFSLAYFSYKQIYRKGEYVVGTEAKFRQAPAEESPEIRSLPAGETVVLTDEIGDWCQVRLVNLDEGWVKRELLLPIVMDGK